MLEAANDIRYRVLENMCLAHTGEKSSLEQASENLSQILNDHVRRQVRSDRERETNGSIRLERQRRSDLCRERMFVRLEEFAEGPTIFETFGETRLEHRRRR